MSVTQTEVTQFYNSLVFPSRPGASAYSHLAAEIIKEGWRVGDFGCGESLFCSVFRHICPQPIFLDVSLNALKTVDYGVKLQADVTQLPLKPSTFDAIFCIGVIHHLPNMYSALQELARVISEGGILVVGVYSPRSLGAWLKRSYDGLPNGLFKKTIFDCATVLLWIKLRGRFRLSWQDTRKRIADLLKTPIVTYRSAAYYQQLAAEAGLKVVERRIISNMNILYFKKCIIHSNTEDRL